MFEPARPQDKALILKRVPLFASCNDEQLHLIAERTRLVEHKKGEIVYREGDPAAAFYIISSGRLRVFLNAGGQEKTLTILHNGDTFGEVSLLIGETHSATVQALNDTLVLQIQKADFEQVINRVPSLVLYLSRLLSKRLRTSQRGGEFSEATIVSLFSAAGGVGRTSFGTALAATLKRETERDVAIVDFSGAASGQAWLYGFAGPRAVTRETLSGSPEELFGASVSTHPLGFSVIGASDLIKEAGGEQAVAPLFSFLTNRFHYVLIDLPLELSPAVLKALTQSDLIYLMTGPRQEHIIRTNALLPQLHMALGPVEQRVKVVLNLQGSTGEPLAVAEIARQLGQPIAFTLPPVNSVAARLAPGELGRLLEQQDTAYARIVRRIARELGGMLVGLALGSGAALGLAHVGILKVIEREKIPIDIVAGSSIGSFVAGLWASGCSAEELERMALQFKNRWDIRQMFMLDLGIPLFSVFIGLLAGAALGWASASWVAGLLFGFMVCVAFGVVVGPLTGGPIQGARLSARLQHDFGGKTFEDTWLPLKVIASNPMAREEVIFDSGSLAEAVRASVSIPGIFKPVRIRGKICLDGGVVSPVPVSVLKRAGAHHVIAVNVFPTTTELIANREEMLRRRAERDAHLASRPLPIRLLYRLRQELLRSVSPLVFDVIMRSMQAMEYQIAEVSCREADLTLRPTVPGSHWLEFYHPEPFIRRGEEVALQHLPELKRIAHVRSVDNPGRGT